MTRVAELTAPGRGAIATLRVWGANAVEVTSAAFRPRGSRSLAETPTGRLRVGRIGAGLGDEVVAVILSRDSPEVEVQCHGGLAAVGLVRDALIAAGAEAASPRAWGRNGPGSQLRAEARAALADAQTLRATAILLNQLCGAWPGALRSVVARLDADEVQGAQSELEGLIARGAFGVRLVAGWRVALAGRPNVGKSRLLNALAGFDRAIVSPQAGTTRDVVTTPTAFDGWPIELADTAGLHAQPLDPIEAAGIARARDQHQGADLVVVVWDRSAALTPADHAVRADHPSALVVASKADLAAAWDADAAGVDLVVSAERGDGIAALGSAIVAQLGLEVPPRGTGVPFRARQIQRLQAIRGCLDRGDLSRARRSLVRWLGSGRLAPRPTPTSSAGQP